MMMVKHVKGIHNTLVGRLTRWELGTMISTDLRPNVIWQEHVVGEGEMSPCSEILRAYTRSDA